MSLICLPLSSFPWHLLLLLLLLLELRLSQSCMSLICLPLSSFPWHLSITLCRSSLVASSTRPSCSLEVWASAKVTSPAFLRTSLRSCQLILELRLVTLILYLVRWGGPYLLTQGARLPSP